MKLSISNIAWTAAWDAAVYEMMKKYNFWGLEIAPTRIMGEQPYENLSAAKEWKKMLTKFYGFEIPSMQSIWYGRKENIFNSVQERKFLLDYTKRAIDFAAAIGCKNIVFGCPRNRNDKNGVAKEAAVPFFTELAEYAVEKGTVIGMEANPPIYQTNFITDTKSAIELVKMVDSKGFGLNLDVGTMLLNEESIDILRGHVELINHVHISEPELKRIKPRSIHVELARLLREESYEKYVSIEMGTQKDKDRIESCMAYIKEIF